MATPSELTPLIEQAWNLDPEENFFEFLYDVLQTNATLFSLGDITHDQLKSALDAYIAAGGAPSGDEEASDGPEADTGNPEGNSSS
jgi:hypothetical protein